MYAFAFVQCYGGLKHAGGGLLAVVRIGHIVLMLFLLLHTLAAQIGTI